MFWFGLVVDFVWWYVVCCFVMNSFLFWYYKGLVVFVWWVELGCFVLALRICCALGGWVGFWVCLLVMVEWFGLGLCVWWFGMLGGMLWLLGFDSTINVVVVIAWCWVYSCVCFGGFYLGMFDMLLVRYCCFVWLVWFGWGCLNVIALVFSFGFCCLFGWGLGWFDWWCCYFCVWVGIVIVVVLLACGLLLCWCLRLVVCLDCFALGCWLFFICCVCCWWV